MKKVYFVFSTPLLLSGCMMLGMGGMGTPGASSMHGASGGSSINGPTLVKEAVIDGIRLTAEFPPYVLGDRLTYRVTVRDARDKSSIANASVALIVTAIDNSHLHSPSGQAGSDSRHADSASTRSQRALRKMVVPPDEIGDGAYVFRPAIATAGAYRFVFVLERVGSDALATPIEVEHTVQLLDRRDRHSGHGDPATRSAMAPAVLIGAGVMAIMMLFMIR